MVATAYDLERLFVHGRRGHNLHISDLQKHDRPREPSPQSSAEITFRKAYEAYLSDPSRRASPKSILAYRTVSDVIMDLIGSDIPLRSITRKICRDLMTDLSKMPRNAKKRWPSFNARQAIERGSQMSVPFISVANVNGHLNKFCAMLNWAVREELLDKNPALGLRLPDPVQAKDKRRPFSAKQLGKIFDAPLFDGCIDDGNGYAKIGPQKPRRARFWVPLIGLLSGARLNEICQLDVEDVAQIEGIWCFTITKDGHITPSDKRLKTASSDRKVPVHPFLLELGFDGYVTAQRQKRSRKLFPELQFRHGLYSHEFSRWFGRFLVSCGAAEDKTCFHSFRHNFADALRRAKVDREISLALGGWIGGGNTSAADRYGNGHSVTQLFEAIKKLSYDEINLRHLVTE